MVNIVLTVVVFIFLFGGIGYSIFLQKDIHTSSFPQKKIQPIASVSITDKSSQLAIATMQQKSYPGSQIIIERELSTGENYKRYEVSYYSDGLKIYGLLTIPNGQRPKDGWPVILFNHGYIPPAQYSTSSSYSTMVNPLASAGYMVFKPDYRGNGQSEGTPHQSYVSSDYVTDSMNALASIKTYKDANPDKIGVFGHSMGGNISLHELVITHAFKAAELMAGVVGNEQDIIEWWAHRIAAHNIVGNDLDTFFIVTQMVKDHNTPDKNQKYWNPLDPTQFIKSISTPIQIQVGSADEEVPTTFSSSLRDLMLRNSKIVDFTIYQGADHNLAPYTSESMHNTIRFFNKYLK